jgi:hypothetical protein
MGKKYDIAAYIWPSYTGDDLRTRLFWPEGMGEWQTVKNAVKKFPGHNWPRKPLWGYVNEADPYIMEMEINCAADHGVNVFIYDWYWYDGRPFLEGCLNKGYLGARNNDKVKFYLMWANHNAGYLWDKRNSDDNDEIIWRGKTSPEEFVYLTDRLIEKYFHHPSYYTINGAPVFMIYDVANLIDGLGGVAETRKALDQFRERTTRRGLPGLHLQLTAWGENVDFSHTGVDGGAITTTAQLAKKLGFDSVTNYQYVHMTNIKRSYTTILPELEGMFRHSGEQYAAYFPHVSVGWDNNPRYTKILDYILEDSTPENFEKALIIAKEYVDSHPNQPPLLTINSWNEWTESSYLEPDDQAGYGYLEAVKRVFDLEGKTNNA